LRLNLSTEIAFPVDTADVSRSPKTPDRLSLLKDALFLAVQNRCKEQEKLKADA